MSADYNNNITLILTVQTLHINNQKILVCLLCFFLLDGYENVRLIECWPTINISLHQGNKSGRSSSYLEVMPCEFCYFIEIYINGWLSNSLCLHLFRKGCSVHIQQWHKNYPLKVNWILIVFTFCPFDIGFHIIIY